MSPDDATPDPGRVVDARPGAPHHEPHWPPTDPTGTDAGDAGAPDAPTPADPVPADDEREAPEAPAAEAPAAEATADPGDPAGAGDWQADEEVAAEVVEGDLAALADERDQYVDQLRRLQADFENYRKRVHKQQEELAERATESLVRELLPVLDACEAAVAHGDASVEPVAKALVDALAKQGLDKVEPTGEAFDPNHHEAVTHEPGDGDQVVTEVLRPGYVWQGRVLRAAMVRVRG